MQSSNSCSHSNLIVHYPQIWSWGISWECEECHKFFLCGCFRKATTTLFETAKIYRVKKQPHPKYLITMFGSEFSPNYLKYLSGGIDIAYFEYHVAQPIFKLQKEHIEESSQWFQKYLDEPSFLFLTNICHLCRKIPSIHHFCGSIYGSWFMQRYGAYIYSQFCEWGLLSPRRPELLPEEIKNKYFDGVVIPEIGSPPAFREGRQQLQRDLDNQLRSKFDFPAIGEGWKNETMVFNAIKQLFPQYKVIHHYRSSWLEGQELDIYIEEVNIGIEYQGEQHFFPIDFFGGENGLEKTIARDEMKQIKCRKNKTELIFFNYYEQITEELIKKRLKNIMSL